MIELNRSGNGRPVLFLHGFLESSTIWSNINLDGFEKICIDLPGHGASAAVVCSTIVEIAELVQSVLQKNSIGSYDVVGHSMGGYVALELMKLDPHCEKLILLNSNFWQDSPDKKLDRMRVSDVVKIKKDHFIVEAIPNLFFEPQSYDKEIRKLIHEARKMTPEAIAASSIAMMNRNDNTELIIAEEERVKIIQGIHDTVVPPGIMKDLLKNRNIDYSLVNSAHMSLMEAEEETIDLIEKFLK